MSGFRKETTLAQTIRQTYPVVALVLQGGGALGAYQAGVYEALDETGLLPNWIAGISIGALNAAIIAGNPPEKRVERLHEFWGTICQSLVVPSPIVPPLSCASAFDMQNWPVMAQAGLSAWAAWQAVTQGQPGFFSPRIPPPFLQTHPTPTTASWYDTAPLRATLERLVDFDRINDPRAMRVSVGAVNVRTSAFAYFDNTRGPLHAEHFMASSALPPGFPAVEIDGEFYWDGGMVSNSPLYKVLVGREHSAALIFQIDLWNPHGKLPDTMNSVAERSKDIQYSSRTRAITEYVRLMQEQRRLLRDLMALVPAERRNEAAWLQAEANAKCPPTNLVHLTYRDKPYEGYYKDYEFSTASMHEHWCSGLADMRDALARPHWLEQPDTRHPFVTHDADLE
ncbi:MAG TPA: patatin-like phospholipase family protein [Acidiphilium sp.]